MAVVENRVSWEATCYILWVSTSRFLFAAIIVLLLPEFVPLPDSVEIVAEHFPFITLAFCIAVSLYIQIWAIRAALRDRYATFTFIAESKWTGESLFLYKKAVGWHVAISVWWAFTWRILLVPAARFVGTVAPAIFLHQDISRAIEAMHRAENLYFLLIFELPAAVWATHESLADRYRGFRFATRPQTVPL